MTEELPVDLNLGQLLIAILDTIKTVVDDMIIKYNSNSINTINPAACLVESMNLDQRAEALEAYRYILTVILYLISEN